MRIFAPAKVVKMVEIIAISTLIIAISMAFLCIKLVFRKDGRFSSQHIHDSKAMRERGIHCVMDQDREQRTKSRLAVKERNN
jgi:hypothetical protein